MEANNTAKKCSKISNFDNIMMLALNWSPFLQLIKYNILYLKEWDVINKKNCIIFCEFLWLVVSRFSEILKIKC